MYRGLIAHDIYESQNFIVFPFLYDPSVGYCNKEKDASWVWNLSSINNALRCFLCVSYGFSVWGTRDFSCINSIENRAMRFDMGVGKTHLMATDQKNLTLNQNLIVSIWKFNQDSTICNFIHLRLDYSKKKHRMTITPQRIKINMV